jgi:hypothetical protein
MNEADNEDIGIEINLIEILRYLKIWKCESTLDEHKQ